MTWLFPAGAALPAAVVPAGRMPQPVIANKRITAGKYQIDVRSSPLPLLCQPLRLRTSTGLDRLQPVLGRFGRSPGLGLNLVCSRNRG